MQRKEEVLALRNEGFSVGRIAVCVGLSKSTVSSWVRGTVISDEVRQELARRKIQGGAKGREVMSAIRALRIRDYESDARSMFFRMFSGDARDLWSFTAAMLFWCEGGKRQLGNLCFINSDPAMIAIFLRALRNGFDLDESKFRPLLHVHEYHDIAKQISYWSGITGIPKERFSKPYLKPNTGTRKREGYQGCLSIRYNDASLARRLSAMYHVFSDI